MLIGELKGHDDRYQHTQSTLLKRHCSPGLTNDAEDSGCTSLNPAPRIVQDKLAGEKGKWARQNDRAMGYGKGYSSGQ